MTTSTQVVTVLAGLYANTCQVCERQHRFQALDRPPHIAVRHAEIMTARGYDGYDYTHEQWVGEVRP